MGTRNGGRRWPELVIPAAVQGTILFLAGLGLAIHEATLPSAEVSWPRLVVWAGMMGGPFAARADGVRRAVQTLRPGELEE
jgi:hypothetical protein